MKRDDKKDVEVGAGEERRARILRDRARKYSTANVETAHVDAFEAVEFVLAHENYAVASEYISEIYPMTEMTPVPCTPNFVLGIINLRGHILSVIDVKKFFNLPEKGLTDLNKVIVLRSDTMEFGVLADAIVGVRLIERARLDASFATLTGRREEYLLGVTKDRVAVLNALKLLADPAIVVRETIDI